MRNLENEFNSLNPEQRKAALHKKGPALVLAGAGSGKTKVVALRIAELISSGIHPMNILGLTFTNKAAQEMKSRVHGLVGQSVLISTFHSLGAKILRESIQHLGYTRDFAIYDEQDVEKLIKTLAKEAFGDTVKADLKKARSLISQAKNGLMKYGEAEFEKLYDLYIKKLKELNAVDFDDLLFLPVLLFQTVPEVLDIYQNRWPYILVDEYQDTNHAQYEFIRLLSSKTGNLFVVGDPDQSIYSWRGANVHNILHFEKDYPGAEVIRLEQNYRSTATIIQAANAVIRRNSNRYEKSLRASIGEGEKIFVFQAMSEREEADFVAETVLTYRAQGMKLSDMVIFYRTNFQSRVFEDELMSKRLPYTIVGGISFYQRKEIKDVLSYLRLLHQPHDLIAFLRIVNLPKRGFGEQFLTKVSAAARSLGVPIADLFLQEPPFSMTARQKEGWADFRKTLEALHTVRRNNNLADLVRAAIHETRYLEVIDEEEETRQEKRENLGELIAKAEEWTRGNPEGSLEQFLEEIALVTSTDVMEEDTDKLSLMTAHNGKGLEFDLVFIVGLEEDLFPHINSKKGDEDAIEEERRLFYVGVTRAKKQLFLTHASLRYIYGRMQPMRQSRFLSEVPDALKKKVNQSLFMFSSARSY